jgi:HEAT repeats
MPSDFGSGGQWERVASELRACREAQQQAWGDLDNATLGRYLAGDVTLEERRRIETALEARPELRMLTDLVSDVLGDCAPLTTQETTARPALIPFRTKTLPPGAKTQRWRRWTALAAAACLLLALGYTVLPRGAVAPSALPPLKEMAMAPAPRSEMQNPVAPGPALAVAGASTASDDKNAAGATSMAPLLDSATLAYADGLNSVAASYQNGGDLNRAEFFYKQAYNVREWKLGPDAPATVETRRNLGEVYQTALNMPDARTFAKVDLPAAAPGVEPSKDGQVQMRTSALQLRDRITRQAVGDVRKSVVPILVQNLREAQTPEAREQLGLALAELGPAAGEAVPVLEECLKKAPTAQERAVVLRALGEMGPTAGASAAPVLVTSMKSPSPEVRRAAADALANYGPAAQDALTKMAAGGPIEHPEWRALRERMRGAEGRIGVRDACELFSPHALKQVQKEIHELAYSAHVEVFAETRCGDAKDEAKSAEDRARETNVNGVYFVIHPSLGTIEIIIGETLRGAGFDDKQLAQLRKVVEEAVGRKEYDQALLEGVRLVARFQAEKTKGAAPEATPTKP